MQFRTYRCQFGRIGERNLDGEDGGYTEDPSRARPWCFLDAQSFLDPYLCLSNGLVGVLKISQPSRTFKSFLDDSSTDQRLTWCDDKQPKYLDQKPRMQCDVLVPHSCLWCLASTIRTGKVESIADIRTDGDVRLKLFKNRPIGLKVVRPDILNFTSSPT